MANDEVEYLTTRELAELLRIKERKVYDLAASGGVPCSRATGKLLFPRREVEAWIAGKRTDSPAPSRPRPPAVFLGSYEPLLEWALRESACGLATLLDGSMDGLERFARGEGVASGLHVYDAAGETWNTAMVEQRFARDPVVLIEFAWRERGLVVAPGLETGFAGPTDLRGRRLVPRQEGAGSQVLLRQLLQGAAVAERAVEWDEVARTESDAALRVLEGKADAAMGLRALAAQFRLGFVPLVRERYDMLVDRGAWFDPPLQALQAFCRSTPFAERAAEMAGYDISGFGRVRFNGP